MSIASTPAYANIIAGVPLSALLRIEYADPHKPMSQTQFFWLDQEISEPIVPSYFSEGFQNKYAAIRFLVQQKLAKSQLDGIDIFSCGDSAIDTTKEGWARFDFDKIFVGLVAYKRSAGRSCLVSLAMVQNMVNDVHHALREIGCQKNASAYLVCETRFCT